MVQQPDDPSTQGSSVTDVSSPAPNNADEVGGEDGPSEGGHSILAGEEDDDGMAIDGSKDNLRRTSAKIANLRAAFEKPDDVALSDGKRRFELSPARSRDGDGEAARWREQHEAAVAKMKAQQEQHQSETVSLKQQLNKEVEMRLAVEDKCTGLEEQVEALQGELAQKGTEFQRELERRTAGLQHDKIRAQREASNLQKQLYELKRGISASTRIDSEVSDSNFTQQFQNLYHETQNWVVNNFRKIKVEKTGDEMCSLLESIAAPKQTQYLRPVFQNFDASIKLAALQATTVCYMMEVFEEPLLYGLPSQQEWRRSIQKAAETLPAVLPPASFNKWRSVTVSVLRQSEHQDITTSLDSAAKSMAEVICITLETLTEIERSASRASSLGAILRRAISLSHLFRVQRARYEFRLPTAGSTFVPDTMEHASFTDGEPVSDRKVRCSTFPSVVKMGDGNGGDAESSNVVIKAMVVCNG